MLESNGLTDEQREEIQNLISHKNKLIKKSKDDLLKLLANKTKANIDSGGKHHKRVLVENSVSKKIGISVFDSSFTRIIGAVPNEFSDSFMVVQVYYYSIIEDLIHNGFWYNGEKYIYFTSSAGQIRTKKCVFVKESIWKEHEKTIMCGLTIDSINEKGGNNPNKHLAYLALTNSATDEWREFDIDKVIVVDDFETNITTTYDLIDDTDYSIKRITGEIPIPHTDGAGMILPNAFGQIQKNKMVRAPWVKGLLGVFDFVKFIEYHGCSPVIKDIYGDKWNVIEDDIQVILTKSQFKLYKYYDNWNQYKEYYKKYNCQTGVTNIESDRIKNTKVSYQMLQSFSDFTEDEINAVAKKSIDRLNGICDSIENIKSFFGVTPYNTHKNAFQKAIDLYPNLLNDTYVKDSLRQAKDTMVKQCKAGKLNVHGKYTFLLPDLYAACEFWFLGKEVPDGLLDDGEVFCWLFRNSKKLDCLRSPHLYQEHAVRINTACAGHEKRERIREWFQTDGVYTSTKDCISKILMFDVDGDASLVVAEESFISLAEKNMKDIVPLYYNMKKAQPVILSNESIYNGLKVAFSHSNIGIYSNNISKVKNSYAFIHGDDGQKQEALDVIKLLCMENNFCIDAAKTLYMPERPKWANDLITSYTKSKLPHYFVYAKDKANTQVEEVCDSFVDRLDSLIKNPRINTRRLKLEAINYELMMNNPDIDVDIQFNKNGTVNKTNTNPVIVRYNELDTLHHFKLADKLKETINPELKMLSVQKQEYIFRKLKKYVHDELSKFGYSDIEVVDILVRYLYGNNKRNKTTLWICYGDILYYNLSRNIRNTKKDVQCVDCGVWFTTSTKNNVKECRCEICLEKHKRVLARERKRRQRERERQSLV